MAIADPPMLETEVPVAQEAVYPVSEIVPESPFHSPDPCHPVRVIVMPPATNSVNGIAQSPGLFLHCLYANGNKGNCC